MFPLIDKLVTKESFALQAWDDRYSKGVWIGIVPSENGLDIVRDLSSAGDLDMIPATDFILDAEWLPILTGRTLIEAMTELEARLSALPPEQVARSSDWSGAVSDALDYLRRANDECRGYGAMDGRLQPLPKVYGGEMPSNF